MEDGLSAGNKKVEVKEMVVVRGVWSWREEEKAKEERPKRAFVMAMCLYVIGIGRANRALLGCGNW